MCDCIYIQHTPLFSALGSDRDAENTPERQKSLAVKFVLAQHREEENKRQSLDEDRFPSTLVSLFNRRLHSATATIT